MYAKILDNNSFGISYYLTHATPGPGVTDSRPLSSTCLSWRWIKTSCYLVIWYFFYSFFFSRSSLSKNLFAAYFFSNFLEIVFHWLVLIFFCVWRKLKNSIEWWKLLFRQLVWMIFYCWVATGQHMTTSSSPVIRVW